MMANVRRLAISARSSPGVIARAHTPSVRAVRGGLDDRSDLGVDERAVAQRQTGLRRRLFAHRGQLGRGLELLALLHPQFELSQRELELLQPLRARLGIGLGVLNLPLE